MSRLLARWSRVLLLGALAFPALSGVAFACEVCYGNAEGATIDAARLGTLFLLGIVILVQTAFAAFFLYLRRAAKRAAIDGIDREWSQLQSDCAGRSGSMNA